MSANNTIILQSYKYLDGQTATNLLIFGSKEVNISVDIEDFESRLRKKNPDQITVEIPALDYMQYGPGRYATPDKFNVIKKIMDGAPAPDGIYSYNDLKQTIDLSSVTENPDFELVKSRIILHYVDLPLEVRWRNATPDSHKFWRIHAGFMASYLINGKFTYEGGLTGSENINDILNKFQYATYLTFGFNTWNAYIHYGLNPYFDKDKTAAENNMTTLKIGLMFYIL